MKRAAHSAPELRSQSLSLAQIGAALDAGQVPTPSGKGRWAKSSVRYVLARFESEQGDGEQ